MPGDRAATPSTHSDLSRPEAALTSMPIRRERLAVTALLVAYAGWIAWITGKTPLNPLPDQFGAGDVIFTLQAGPALVAAALAIADAIVAGRNGILRWMADLVALSTGLVIAGFAAFLALIGVSGAYIPAAAALLILVIEIRTVVRVLRWRS